MFIAHAGFCFQTVHKKIQSVQGVDKKNAMLYDINNS